MKTLRNLCALCVCLALTFAALPVGAQADVEGMLQVEYKDKDRDASWSDADATRIIFDGESAAIDGTGAALEGGVLSITEAGDYLLTGAFTGRVEVEVGKENDKVRLILSGATIESASLPAIFCRQGDKLTLTLADGTQNTVTASGQTTTESDEELDAAIYSKADLVINGAGSLAVTSDAHGILSKDDVIVTGGTIEIDAAQDGLRGKDAVKIADGALTIRAQGDGVKSNNAEDAERGYVSIDGGTINIISGEDGVQAETTLQITAGTLNVTAGGGCGAQANTADETSCKGLKAGARLIVTGGDITVDSHDDALHSNGSAHIADGALTLSTGDDALHAEADVTVSGGQIAVLQSYEGIEGVDIFITGGDIDIVASDDALNAAGGAQAETQSGQMGRWGGRGGFAAGDYSIVISGGRVVLDAGGDGLDSNGTAELTGGALYICGPTSNGNSAIDADGAMTVTGGTLAAVGSAGMAQVPQSDGQPVLAAVVSDGQAGQPVSLRDASGRTLVSFTPDKAWQHVVFSAPDITVGETYGIYLGDTLALEVTQDNTVTQSGSSFGGFGGFGGGMRPEGGRGGFGGERGGKPFVPGEAPTLPDGTTPQRPDAGTMPTPKKDTAEEGAASQIEPGESDL